MKPEEEFISWVDTQNFTAYETSEGWDFAKAAAMHFLAIGRKQGIEEAAEVAKKRFAFELSKELLALKEKV